MADKDAAAVVIDNGANTIIAGIAGQEVPKVIFPCITGRPRPQMADLLGKDQFVGGEAQSKRGALSLKCPIEYGVITEWDDMEKIWHHTFKELNMAPEEHPVLLTEAPLIPKANREKMTQMMFETFRTPSLCLAMQPVLAQYATGHLDGIVLDSGHSVTHAVPIREGYAIFEGITRLNYAGRDLTDLLIKMVIESGKSLTARASHDVFQNIKEEACYVARDLAKEQAEDGASLERSFELPGEETVTIKEERFRCAEALFQPSLLGSDMMGIHQAIHDSISRCDESFRASLYNSVVLAGGSTMFAGMEERLQQELTALAPAGTVINMVAPKSRLYSAWIGGSIMGSLPACKDVFITRQEYEESGPSIVHTRCSGQRPAKE